MNLTARQMAFLNVYKSGPGLTLAEAMHMVDTGSLDGFDKLTAKQISTKSNRAIYLRNSLIRAGLLPKIDRVLKDKNKAIEKEVKNLAGMVKEYNGEVKGEILVGNFVDKINYILDKHRDKSEEVLNRIEKDTFTENVLRLYGSFDSDTVQGLRTKEEQIKHLYAMFCYGTSIETYTSEKCSEKKYMRHPQIAFQCMRMIAELSGTLQPTSTNVKIQINNLLQSIEAKRIKELSEDSVEMMIA